MQPESIIVRVARAIAATQDSADWRNYLEAARAAIAAMREPSPGMLDAALSGLPDWGTLPDDWRNMIDHALASGKDCASPQQR